MQKVFVTDTLEILHTFIENHTYNTPKATEIFFHYCLSIIVMSYTKADFTIYAYLFLNAACIKLLWSKSSVISPSFLHLIKWVLRLWRMWFTSFLVYYK